MLTQEQIEEQDIEARMLAAERQNELNHLQASFGFLGEVFEGFCVSELVFPELPSPHGVMMMFVGPVFVIKGIELLRSVSRHDWEEFKQYFKEMAQWVSLGMMKKFSKEVLILGAVIACGYGVGLATVSVSNDDIENRDHPLNDLVQFLKRNFMLVDYTAALLGYAIFRGFFMLAHCGDPVEEVKDRDNKSLYHLQKLTDFTVQLLQALSFSELLRTQFKNYGLSWPQQYYQLAFLAPSFLHYTQRVIIHLTHVPHPLTELVLAVKKKKPQPQETVTTCAKVIAVSKEMGVATFILMTTMGANIAVIELRKKYDPDYRPETEPSYGLFLAQCALMFTCSKIVEKTFLITISHSPKLFAGAKYAGQQTAEIMMSTSSKMLDAGKNLGAKVMGVFARCKKTNVDEHSALLASPQLSPRFVQINS